MARPQHHILFPVETINRELDFRILLGAMIVEPGMRVFIGQLRRINRMIADLRGGIYLGKDIVFYKKGQEQRFYTPLRKNGFSHLYLVEEGAMWRGGEADWHGRLDWDYEKRVRFFSPDDTLCNWGSFQNEHFQAKIPEMAANMRVTGHPRFDIYKTKYRSYYNGDVEELRKRYGRFVLINTNLGRANNSKGPADGLLRFYNKNGYVPGNSAEHLQFVGEWAHENTLLGGMVTLMHRLSVEFPDLSFVLRPHPSENQEFYKTVFTGLKNVVVEHTGAVGPWILASEMLIHDGCTTAVEAYLSDKPIINYKSVERQEFDIPIPNELGLRAQTQDEVVDALRRHLRTGQGVGSAQPSELACSMLNNFREDGCELMLATMREALGRAGSPGAESMAAIVTRDKLRQLRDMPKNMTRPLSRKAEVFAADRQKFYGFEEEALARKFTAVQKLLNKPLFYRRISSQLITIDPG